MSTALMRYRDRWAVEDPVLDFAIELVERKRDHDEYLVMLYAEADKCKCIRIDVDLDDNRGCPRHDRAIAAEIQAQIDAEEARPW